MKFCASCGLSLPNSAVFCARCGSSVPAGPAATPVTVSTAPTTPTASSALAPSQPTAASAATAPIAVTQLPEPAGAAGQDWAPVAAHPPRTARRTGPILAAAAAFVLLLVAGGVAVVMYLGKTTADSFNQAARQLNQQSQGEQGPSPDIAPLTPVTPEPEQPSVDDTPQPLDTTTPLVEPAGGKLCSTLGSGPFATAAAGNDHTSCPFADAVRDAYQASGADGADTTLNVFSPVTKKDYDMLCTGPAPIACTGGNDALVLIGSLSGTG